jgi:hypothetical protein
MGVTWRTPDGPCRPHELRHTAASRAIAPGAAVKVVQQMLGHASAAMDAARAADVFPMCARAEIAATEASPEMEKARLTGPFVECPRQDSNLRTRLRRAKR